MDASGAGRAFIDFITGGAERVVLGRLEKMSRQNRVWLILDNPSRRFVEMCARWWRCWI